MKKKEESEVTVGVKIPYALDRAIEKEAHKRNMPKRQVIIHCLNLGLEVFSA